MKKSLLILLTVIVVSCGFLFGFIYLFNEYIKPDKTMAVVKNNVKKPIVYDVNAQDVFFVYVENEITAAFYTLEEAIEYSKGVKSSFVKHRDSDKWLYENYKAYNVYENETDFSEFETFLEALNFAKTKQSAFIYYRKNNALVWSNEEQLKSSNKILGVELVKQLPELRRGCEVTSLSMLLNYFGAKVDKMTLAAEIAKDNSPYETKNGVVYWGDPNVGFVGEMTAAANGFGVYHKPIYDLATKYFPDATHDLTGAEFDDVLKFVSKGSPVWVIINTKYEQLPASSFVTWQAKSGTIKTTYSEHAVIIVGYDEQNVYFNDPLGAATSATRVNFKKCWEQMGKQAVTIVE